MSAVDATLRVVMLGIDKSASRTLENVGRKADKVGGAAGKLGALGAKAGIALSAGFAAAGVAALKFGSDAVDAASRSEQSVGGVAAVFGKDAKDIERSAAGAAENLGLSANAYREFATVLGAGLKNKGIKDYAGQTESLIGVGADLAAQFGGPTSDAVDALASAMRGESDPIEKYGVSLNETAVNAELAARGQDKLKGKALDTAKAQARLALITRQTADAQGAFAREADTNAGKQARATAAFENMQARIGQKLLPAMEGLTQAGMDVMEWLDRNPKVAAGAAAAFDLLGSALAGIWDVVRKFVAPAIAWLLDGFASATRGLGVMLEALGTIPGFEWARDAAAKVNQTAAGIDAVADGLRALGKDTPPKVDIEDKVSAKAAAIQTKMDGIRDKIVTAKAKGDDKEVDRLKRKLEKLEKRKFSVLVTAGVTMNKNADEIVYKVGGSGTMRFSARRRGGPVTKGQPYMVGEDEPELFVPDTSGWVLNGQQMRRAAAGAARSVAAGGAGGGVTYQYNIDVRGVLTEAQAGREIDRVLTRHKQSRNGRLLGFEAAR